MKQLAAREQLQRQKNLTKYVPDAASAIFKVLQVRIKLPDHKSALTCSLPSHAVCLADRLATPHMSASAQAQGSPSIH